MRIISAHSCSFLFWQVEEASEDGRVVKKLVKKGENYKRPNEGATVKIAYQGRVGSPDGPVFDERSREDPLEFVVDSGEPAYGLPCKATAC